MQLNEIVDLVGGRLIAGTDRRADPSVVCIGANPPDQATAGEVTLIDDVRRRDVLVDCRAVAVVTPAEIPSCSMPQIVVDHPHDAFAMIVSHFRPPIAVEELPAGIDAAADIDPTAYIHPSAIIGAGVAIGARTRIMPGVVIMPRSRIGDDCVVHANVTLYEYTQIGDRVTLHAGTVIGANGFGYRQHQGRHVPTSQLGYVAIENDVEVGASVTIDRGTYGATRIGEGTKIDNQVMIAHNCQIGRHNLLCSQVGIAGSCRTGDYVILAGQVGLKDHITLGDHAIVGAQAGVMDDSPGCEVYLGSPATPQREQMQIMAVQRRLPEMRREVKRLRREVDQLQADAACRDADSDRHAA